MQKNKSKAQIVYVHVFVFNNAILDACQGDRGGPLMCHDHHNGATLRGNVSFGPGCARPELAVS